MKITKYYCDCCGQEVKTNDDLTCIDIYSNFKYMQDSEYPYDTREICQECKDKIEDAILNKFKEINNKKEDIKNAKM